MISYSATFQMAVQKGTGQYTKWYKAVQVKVQQGTRQYMAVHVSALSAFAPGRGRARGAGGAADFGALLKSLH
jgi:hypothetical protein